MKINLCGQIAYYHRSVSITVVGIHNICWKKVTHGDEARHRANATYKVHEERRN